MLRLGGNLILSRLLFPGAFGVMTLLTLLLMGLQMMSDVGFGQCVVQHPRGTERRFQNTVWTMQIVRGAGVFAVLCILGAIIPHIYGPDTLSDYPRFLKYTPWIALGGLLSSFDSTRLMMASRSLAVRRVVAIDLGAQCVGLAVMVVWAKLRPSLDALIAGELVRTTLRMSASHVLLPGDRNGIAWDREVVAYVLRFGKWVAASSAMTFVAMQSDRLILAKLMPIADVGVYGIALMLANLPATVLSRLGVSMLYPALAQRRRIDPSSFGSALLRLRAALLPLALAISVTIAIVSPAFFRYFYDERYRAAMWLCPALCPYVWFSALQASCDRALLALEQSRALAISRIVNFVATVAGCWIGFEIAHLPGLVVGVIASNLLGHLVVVVALAKNGISIVRQDLKYTAAALAIGCLGWLAQRFLYRGVPDLASALLRAPALLVIPALTCLWAIRRTRRRLRTSPAANPVVSA